MSNTAAVSLKKDSSFSIQGILLTLASSIADFIHKRYTLLTLKSIYVHKSSVIVAHD